MRDKKVRNEAGAEVWVPGDWPDSMLQEKGLTVIEDVPAESPAPIDAGSTEEAFTADGSTIFDVVAMARDRAVFEAMSWPTLKKTAKDGYDINVKGKNKVAIINEIMAIPKG